MVLVEISHADMPEKMEIEEGVRKFLGKFEKRWKITKFKLDVDSYAKDGRKKYSMHAHVIAEDRTYIAKVHSWDMPSTLGELFEKLGKEIGKEQKKERQQKIYKKRKFLSRTE